MNARKLGVGAALLCAAIGFAASIYAYFTPSTGVNGTAGPLLTAFGHGAMVISALLLLATRWLPGLLLFLMALAAVLTAFAGYLLLQPAIWASALLAGILAILGHSIGKSS